MTETKNLSFKKKQINNQPNQGKI